MSKGRLEAFSDGVFAIIITIMVLELKVPHGEDLSALTPLWPVFVSYILSFVNVAIYWNNHHHMLQASRHVTGSVLWANSHLLFWLSLIPVATGWMGQNHFAAWPVAAYGLVLLLSGCGYFILSRCLVAAHGSDSHLRRALGSDLKGKTSLALYAAGVPLSFLTQWGALGLYVLVALLWLVPDRRIERALGST